MAGKKTRNVYHLKTFQWKGPFHFISTETAAYLIEEHGNNAKRQNATRYSEHSGKSDKKGIPLGVFLFFFLKLFQSEGPFHLIFHKEKLVCRYKCKAF